MTSLPRPLRHTLLVLVLAFGVAQGAKPDIDPGAFSVVDGKLYLNLDPSVQARWLKDTPGYIKAADKNWKTIANK